MMTEALKKTILVVDDAPENIHLIKGLLGRQFKIKAALEGEKALKIAVKGADLILLDIQMPGMDGFEACRRLKEQPDTAAIPVVFLSGEEEAEHKERAAELGAASFFSKPVDPIQFSRFVFKLLE